MSDIPAMQNIRTPSARAPRGPGAPQHEASLQALHALLQAKGTRPPHPLDGGPIPLRDLRFEPGPHVRHVKRATLRSPERVTMVPTIRAVFVDGSRYPGPELRKLRAERGVGRPR